MDEVLKKLNYKGQKEIVVLNMPDSFKIHLEGIDAIVSHNLNQNTINFILCFVLKKVETEKLVPEIVPRLNDDAVIYFCYPKGTSKKYKCDFNRDNGWEIMAKFDLDSVRMVSIDEDWSALRFRQKRFIKELKRKS